MQNKETGVYLHRQNKETRFDMEMSHSIRVVQVILVHLVLVRIQVGQQKRVTKSSSLFLCHPHDNGDRQDRFGFLFRYHFYTFAKTF